MPIGEFAEKDNCIIVEVPETGTVSWQDNEDNTRGSDKMKDEFDSSYVFIP